MDKGQFCLPRFLGGHIPKNLSTLNRPDCEVTCSMVHGRLIYVAIADEGEATGSSWVIEVLNRSLDIAYRQAQQRGYSWPNVLKLWADNTPKEPNMIKSVSIFGDFMFWGRQYGRNSTFLALYKTHLTMPQECKNGIFGGWCASMTGAGFFTQVSIEHLCVGHTHEDVGHLAQLGDRFFVITTISNHGQLLLQVLADPRRLLWAVEQVHWIW